MLITLKGLSKKLSRRRAAPIRTFHVSMTADLSYEQAQSSPTTSQLHLPNSSFSLFLTKETVQGRASLRFFPGRQLHFTDKKICLDVSSSSQKNILMCSRHPGKTIFTARNLHAACPLMKRLTKAHKFEEKEPKQTTTTITTIEPKRSNIKTSEVTLIAE